MFFWAIVDTAPWMSSHQLSVLLISGNMLLVLLGFGFASKLNAKTRVHGSDLFVLMLEAFAWASILRIGLSALPEIVRLLMLIYTNVFASLSFNDSGLMFSKDIPLAILDTPIQSTSVGTQGRFFGQGFFGRICIALGAGLHEEMVFRVLPWCLFLSRYQAPAKRARKHQRVLKRYPLSSFDAVYVSTTSLLFAFAHIPFEDFSNDPILFLSRLVSGAFLALIFRTRGFLAALFVHGIYDLLVLTTS